MCRMGYMSMHISLYMYRCYISPSAGPHFDPTHFPAWFVYLSVSAFVGLYLQLLLLSQLRLRFQLELSF